MRFIFGWYTLSAILAPRPSDLENGVELNSVIVISAYDGRLSPSAHAEVSTLALDRTALIITGHHRAANNDHCLSVVCRAV